METRQAPRQAQHRLGARQVMINQLPLSCSQLVGEVREPERQSPPRWVGRNVVSGFLRQARRRWAGPAEGFRTPGLLKNLLGGRPAGSLPPFTSVVAGNGPPLFPTWQDMARPGDPVALLPCVSLQRGSSQACRHTHRRGGPYL